MFLDVLAIDFKPIGDAFHYGFIAFGTIVFVILYYYTIKDISDYKENKLNEAGEPKITKKGLRFIIGFDIVFVMIVLIYILIRYILVF